MAIEIYLYVLAVVLFAGMFFGLLLSYRESEAERAHAASKTTRTQPSTFFGWRSRDEALIAEVSLRQLEHHLRQEVLHAERFIDDPRPETLRAGCRSGIELQ
ncbi:MAG: hypothetical protein Q7J25_05945 [Vicinamibacterales bacterium]|nr:hypothetical protein [Vicinamibacterales bacterium]